MASFEIAIDKILTNEGGYQNNPNDYGNYNSNGDLVGTNYGISAKVLEDWLVHVPTQTEMKNLTINQAKQIYKTEYWDYFHLSDIKDQYLAEHIFDILINSGPSSGARIIQKGINDTITNAVIVDGAFGPKTREAINRIISSGRAEELNNNIASERISFFNRIAIPDSDFIKGWIARAESFLNYSPSHTSSILGVLILGTIFFL